MNYNGNMPDWHQYNSPQSIGPEVSSVGQNVNHSPIFGPSISPRRLAGPNFGNEVLNKPQNDASFNPRNFQQSPHAINGPNVPPENSAVAPAAQMPGCHGHYGTPSPRHAMIENAANAPLDSRIPRNDNLSDAMGQRNRQMPTNGPAGHLNCPAVDGSMGIIGQRNAATGIQGPIPAGVRQTPGSYVACKGPCCNSDANLSYQSWEKFGPYPPNVPYRDTGYALDNRRFGSEFENRESLASGTYGIDPRRNFPEYKYRKDSIMPRGYPHASGVIQNYPVQNYNFPGDYQKYSGYPVKEYSRDSSIANPQNPAVLKYQEQSVIVQQKYFAKQVQYQNGIVPKNVVSANMGGNVISRARNPYFNPQLARDIPREYSESASLANRGAQAANSVHANYSKYQMYQQKIAMQRFSMENHLRELGRIPGYQSHPKYQERILRYKELLRLQQTVDYQCTLPDAPRVISSQVNDEIPSINLQFDQTGTLINSNFAPAGFTLLQNSSSAENSKNLDGATNNREAEPQLHLQHPNQYKTQPSFDHAARDQNLSSLSQGGPPRENQERYSMARELNRQEYRAQKSQGDGLDVSNSEDGRTSSLDHKNSRDFADKPELDVRQFLANWDESEDEDGANANLPDVASNSSTSVVVEYGSAKSVSNSIEESENCSETQDWQGADDRRMLENTKNEIKSSNSAMADQIHGYDSPAHEERSKSSQRDSNNADSVKTAVRIGTVIRSTGVDCDSETSFRITEPSDDRRDTQGDVESSCRDAESSSIKESPETSPSMKVDVAANDESSTREEATTSVKGRDEAHEYEAEAGIPSAIEERKRDDDGRSSVEKDSAENTRGRYSSSEDLSESSDIDGTDSDAVSSLADNRETIKGTEIHVDARELSISPKSNSAIAESPDLQKRNSFASEESHNPDDISLPDLPTSECTPISTTLNTPIHSDSEESSDPVIDLTIPTNPIEIIQNSPMLSFMHSPIKMEPYEHFDENDLKEEASSHDGLEFKFQTCNRSDDDFEEPIRLRSREVERSDDPQRSDDAFDSDSIEILRENGEESVKKDRRRVHAKDVLIGSVAGDDESAIEDRFAFKKENDVVTGDANGATDTNRRVWQSVSAEEHQSQMSDTDKYQDDKTAIDKLKDLSDMERRLSMTSRDNDEDHSENELVCAFKAESPRGSGQWQLRTAECEITDTEGGSADGLTALNLVKDESKIDAEPMKAGVETATFEAARQENVCSPSRSNARMDFQRSNRGDCDSSSTDGQGAYASSESAELYSSSSEEDQIYTKTAENPANFSSSLNFPLIPGEDFEEPKMPVLPMEGNCLTKIIKNTSPIIDLDVHGSDDDKLDKMDDIWMEVSGVDAVGKVADANMDGVPESGENSSREKNFASRNNPCKSQKSEWKRAKSSVQAKDEDKLIVNSSDGTIGDDRKKWQPHGSSDSDKAARKEAETVDENSDGAVIASRVPITLKTASNRSFREGGGSHHDICSETSATVLMKCQEKVNNINDIATKLLENARLFEPELRKMEAQRSETNCNDDSRDDGKNRTTLSKEFRKVKNRTSLAEPTVNSANPLAEVESNIASPIDTVEGESARIDEVFEFDDRIAKNQTIVVPGNSDCSGEEANANVENDKPCTPFADIAIPEEKHGRVSESGEEFSENGDTAGEAGGITVRDGNSGISCNTLNKEVVNIFEKDITECAIDLSKSLNRFDSLRTLREDCRINYNPNSPKRDGIDNTEELTGIVDEMNREANFTETKKNRCPHSSQFLVAEDSVSSGRSTKENVEVSEAKNTEEHVESVGNNRADNLTSTRPNPNEEFVTDGETSYRENRRLTTTSECEEADKLARNPEENKGAFEFDREAGKMTAVIRDSGENVTDIVKFDANETNKDFSEPGDHTEVYDLVAIGDEKAEPTVDEIVNPEISRDPKNCNDGPKEHLSNAPEGEISLPPVNGDSEETDVISSEIRTDRTPLCDVLENFEESMTTKGVEETHRMTVDNCETNDPKSIEDLDATSDSRNAAAELSHEDPKKSEKSPVEFSDLEYLKSSDLNDTNLPLRTDKSSRMVDARSEPFESHNSFNCDFNNFDVAPNIDSTGDHDDDDDGSGGWKYSKACARFEDCERYKNPDSFIDTISTSLESLDNLNTVPVYTTKDGKITYSPNPKFTYRALIIEAREREGYPVVRESYCGNDSRTQESSHYANNPSTLRKRKNSEGYGCSRSYGKKNYEPKEHGESSTKNTHEPWKRSGSDRGKYRHRARVRNPHHSAHSCNADARKRNAAEKTMRGRMSNKYAYKKAASIFSEYDKTRNGASNNYRCNDTIPYRQSKERPDLDPASSRHKQDSKCDRQNVSETIPFQPDEIETFDVLKINNSQNAISTEEFLPYPKTTLRSMDRSSAAKFTSISDQFEHTSGSAENGSPAKSEANRSGDMGHVVPNPNRGELKSTHLTIADEYSKEEKLMQSSDDRAIDSPSKFVPNETEEKDRDEKIKVPALYDDIDNCEIVTPNTNYMNESRNADFSNADCAIPVNFIKSSRASERFDEDDCGAVKPDVKRDESAVDNAAAEDSPCSIPNQLIERVECSDRAKIIDGETLEMPYDNESAPSSNVETKNSSADKLNEPNNRPSDRLSSNSTEYLTVEVRDTDRDENLSKKETSGGEQSELENSKSFDGVEIDVVAIESNNESSESLKIPCNVERVEDDPKMKREEPRFENNEREPENRNKTSLKNVEIKCSEALSPEATFERENESKHRAQSENYIAYSPSSEHPENIKGIPKLVIKKAESSNCKNVCLDQPLTLSHGPTSGKLREKVEQNFKSSVHPKIPKILIRNVKSRPSTPSTDETIAEKKVFSVTTEEGNKVPKVKIRLDEIRPNSPAVSASENSSKFDTTEGKVPKMKIKLEDRLPKMFIKNVNAEPSQMEANAQKMVPKMKIKKLKGALSQVVDARVLSVSIPRMFVYAELENEDRTSPTTAPGERKVGEPDESSESVAPNSIPCDRKTIKNTECKKVPKLKIKKQSSGCSAESSRKRHNVNPIDSELKKTKKSCRTIGPNDKKYSSRFSVSSENLHSPKKESFSVKQSYELAASFEKVEYTTAVKIRGDQQNSTLGNSLSETPEEIPKVIIKRASPSAEFKCELSKGRRDAIIKNRRWQPEVKLQRSWVLDCMAKDLDLDRLRLKLATPGSILKKSSIRKQCDAEGAKEVKNDDSATNRREIKLFRSKSTSDLVPAHGDVGSIRELGTGRLNETNLVDPTTELTTRERCKSDLGSSFTRYSRDLQCRKKLKFGSDPSDVQSILKHALDRSNGSENTSYIKSTEKRDAVVEKLRKLEDSNTGSENLPDSKSTNGSTYRVETSKRNPNKTLDENMNSHGGLCTSKMNRCIDSLMNNETSGIPVVVDVDSNLAIPSSFTSTTSAPASKCECLENNIPTDHFDANDSCSRGLPTERGGQCYDRVELHAAEITGDLGSVDKLKEEFASDDNASRANRTNRVGERSMSPAAVVRQGDVLNMSVNNRDNPTNSDVKDTRDPMVDGDTRNGSRETIVTEEDSVLAHECREESQPMVGTLSASPIFDGSEIEIQSCPVADRDNDMCLYHEDAIPTEFELELGITDDTMPDASEVPMPENTYCVQEFRISDEPGESSHKSDPMSDDSEDAANPEDSQSEISSTQKSGTNSFRVRVATCKRKTSKDTDKQCTILAADNDKKKSKSTVYIESASELYANVRESVCREDLLIKEVMAAKEMLRKYLARSKNESEFKLKARPKTAAEKKQGSGFNLGMVLTREHDSEPTNRTAESANRSEKPLQSEKKTEFRVNALKSERKHSKVNGHNSKQKKYSSLPKIVQEYTTVLAPTIEGCDSIPQHGSSDVEDGVALAGDETTISLRNSKNSRKNHFRSDTRKKTPELMNSKDSKFRSKSSRQDGDSKCVGKSKSTLSNAAARESNVDVDHCKDKSVSDAVSPEYNSPISSSDQNFKSMTDKRKFKPYKIPKIIKSTHCETVKSTEGLQETRRGKEVRMPILEPQVHVNRDFEASEFGVGREASRSPPVITNQEIVAGRETTALISRDDGCRAPSNKRREVSLEQRTTPLEKEVPEAVSHGKETTVADIVNDMAYHEKATIRHRRYCTLCERWFPTVARHRRHLSGYQHRHTELTQRRTIHTLFTLFTGRPCPRLQPPGIARIDCEPGEPTPLQIAVEGVTKESNKVAGNIRTSTSEEK